MTYNGDIAVRNVGQTGLMTSTDTDLSRRTFLSLLGISSASLLAGCASSGTGDAIRQQASAIGSDFRQMFSPGVSDAELAFPAGEGLRDAALAGGARVTWVPFEGGHEIPLVVWRALRQFLRTMDAGR